jgi:hypothetical protein
MSDEKMTTVELALDIDRHADLIYGTNAVWSGKGDTQAIPAVIAVLMHRNHPDVYIVHGATARPGAEIIKEAEDAAAGLEVVRLSVNGQVFTTEELAAMPDDDVRAEAQARGYKLHPRLNPENMRAAFLAAQNAPQDDSNPNEKTRVL